jgi:hypothetical protein
MGVTRRVVKKSRQPQDLQIPSILAMGALERNDPELALRVLRDCTRQPKFARTYAAAYFGQMDGAR